MTSESQRSQTVFDTITKASNDCRAAIQQPNANIIVALNAYRDSITQVVTSLDRNIDTLTLSLDDKANKFITEMKEFRKIIDTVVIRATALTVLLISMLCTN
jgi:hypothetical protein